MNPFPAYVVRRDDDKSIHAQVESLSVDELPPGDVLIEVEYSSLNYKDALASRGHPGVVSQFPHVPGIDCAGKVVESTTDQYRIGDQVLVTGYGMGAENWGGYSGYVRVPDEWIVPLPAGLTIRESMMYGTAGFTAAQCVSAIVDRGIEPDRGDVLVTGATGGVGSLSVAILAKLGYSVAAVTGKSEKHDWLRQLGAASVLQRSEVNDESRRPLLASRWAAAVDTVGGQPLATVLRSMHHRAVVSACGLTAGDQLSLTVYPFILRGVTLAGIDSAKCPRAERLQMWQLLSGPWRPDQLSELTSEVDFSQLPSAIDSILAGQLSGRTLVRLSHASI